ncbi:MAG TPA: bacteriohemerythrin [Wenzhouxiangella sp.]|nr:bacteriohemerythrin [Wenzhouxiangella sp.]
MTAFLWNQSFSTGLGAVDVQHRHLVDLINHLGDQLADNRFSEDDLEAIIRELVDYAQYHFAEEEDLMARASMDARHVESHKAAHAGFIEEVLLLQKGLGNESPQAARRLLDYLCHWLVYHILGQDQNMAEQLKAIAVGASPAEAFERQRETVDSATAPLLTALSGLFEQVSERNRELVQLTQTLEERVQRRTRELVEANQKLETLSLTDALTGLPNRRHARNWLEKFWSESVSDESPLVCIMLDADNFKTVNDTCGHDAGDRVLVEFARTLRDALRMEDLVFRLGGDEFLVVCPYTDLEGGLKVAQRIHQAISALRVPAGDSHWLGSASIGVAARTPAMNHLDELVQLADRGVYLAKQQGRNCIRNANLSA